MKKLVLMAVAIVAVSFASCGGNKAANAEATEQLMLKLLKTQPLLLKK